jgi:tetratricopeptide (TPR) repeat protein
MHGPIAVANDTPKPLLAQALEVLAELEWRRGAVGEATNLAGESVRLARAAEDTETEARALMVLGAAVGQAGESEQAMTYFEQAAKTLRGSEQTRDLTWAVAGVAYLELERANYQRAAALSEEALQLLASRNDWARAGNLQKLAFARLHLGELEKANTLLDESLLIAESLGDAHTLASYLLGKSALLARAQQPISAAQLGGAAEAAFAAIDVPLGRFEASMHDRTRDQLSEELGQRRLAQAWSEGRDMNQQDALTLARTESAS